MEKNMELTNFEEVTSCDVMEDVEVVEHIDEINLKNGAEIQSKQYSKIFDTNFYWDIPYKINVEKYKEIVGDENRMTDENLSTMRFSCDLWRGDYGDTIHFTFYSWTNNHIDDDSNEWHYNCYQKSDYYGEYTFKDFKEYIIKITECIIGIDDHFIEKKVKDNIHNIEAIRKQNKHILKIQKEFHGRSNTGN